MSGVHEALTQALLRSFREQADGGQHMDRESGDDAVLLDGWFDFEQVADDLLNDEGMSQFDGDRTFMKARIMHQRRELRNLNRRVDHTRLLEDVINPLRMEVKRLNRALVLAGSSHSTYDFSVIL